MFKWMYVHVKENKNKKSIWIIVVFLPAVGGILVFVHIFSKPDNIGALISYSQTDLVMQYGFCSAIPIFLSEF
jgi:hypothetical protein